MDIHLIYVILFDAIRQKDVYTIQSCISDSRIDVNKAIQGQTILDIAIESGSVEVFY